MRRVTISDDHVVIDVGALTGLLVGRRTLTVPRDRIECASVASRGELEQRVDHRVLGVGPHDGQRRPGRRRVGSMLGRDVRGLQFWAVDAGPPSQRLVVLDLAPPVRNFRRIVLSSERADQVVQALGGDVTPSG